MLSFYELFAVSVLATILYLFWNNSNSKLVIPNLSRRRVLITGCDVGIGRVLTKKLDEMGIYVYAGCYLESSIAGIEKECSSRVKGVQLDVTNAESIKNAVEVVEKDLNGDALWGVVNNAGLAGVIAPFEMLTLEDFQKVFGVNFFGIVSVTKHFLPLIRRGNEGRIIMVSSMLGRVNIIAEPYTCSKHALEGLAGGLCVDLAPFNITTHVLNPTFYTTNLNNTEVQKKEILNRFENLPDRVKRDYGKDFLESRIDMVTNLMSSGRTNFDPLMNSFIHALTAVYPQERYSFISPDSYVFVPYSKLSKKLQISLLMFVRSLRGKKMDPAQMRR